MPKLRTLSAKKVILIFKRVGFSVSGQKGSHIKLARASFLGKQILTIPNHKELDRGTLGWSNFQSGEEIRSRRRIDKVFLYRVVLGYNTKC